MRPVSDGITFSNIAANTAPFTLEAGQYGMDTISTGTGTITLQKLAADGATWVAAFTGVTTTTSYTAVSLPRGTYRVAVATFTAVYVSIARIPTD